MVGTLLAGGSAFGQVVEGYAESGAVFIPSGINALCTLPNGNHAIPEFDQDRVIEIDRATGATTMVTVGVDWPDLRGIAFLSSEPNAKPVAVNGPPTTSGPLTGSPARRPAPAGSPGAHVRALGLHAKVRSVLLARVWIELGRCRPD